MSSTDGDASDDYKSSSSSEDESEPSGREYSSQDESSDEDVRETLSCLQPYQFEPGVVGKISETDSESDSDDTSSVHSHNVKVDAEERAGKLGWCKHSNCQLEERDLDCLCCQEMSAIDEAKFEGMLVSEN